MRVCFSAVFLICVSSCLGQDQHSVPNLADGHTVPYSNMYIVEEEGDFVGWDLRVTKNSDEYRITPFCGEGEPEGPIRASSHLEDGAVVIHPNNKICGEWIELRFGARGVRIKVDDGDVEFVPQRKDFIKEARWR